METTDDTKPPTLTRFIARVRPWGDTNPLVYIGQKYTTKDIDDAKLFNKVGHAKLSIRSFLTGKRYKNPNNWEIIEVKCEVIEHRERSKNE